MTADMRNVLPRPAEMDSRVAVLTAPTSYDDQEAIFQRVHAALEALQLPSDFVCPGDRVVLKPNWIKEHDERYPGPDSWEHVVTHPTMIEAVVRWTADRLRGKGSISICDAPQTDSSFETLRRYCELDVMIERCRRTHPDIEIEMLDLRPEEWETHDGVTVSRRSLSGDPQGTTHVRLDAGSEFVGYQGEGRLYGASYDMAETNLRHHGTRHEYMLCRTPMDADLFINMPKLKTHKKVGVTCALKNLVGITANKNWLPHHTEGTPDWGGDQFSSATRKARLERALMATAKRWLKNRPRLSRLFVPLKKAGRLYFGDTQQVVRSGNWHGNDTCWRMVLDLNKCLFFFDGSGRRRQTPLRYLAVVDGIVGGEGNGPMAPDPKPVGVVLAATNPVAADCVAATLMGFDWRKLRLLWHAFAQREPSFVSFGPGDVEVVSDKFAWRGGLHALEETFHFRPHFGWVGAIEKEVSVLR